jgi:hypothetical protein
MTDVEVNNRVGVSDPFERAKTSRRVPTRLFVLGRYNSRGLGGQRPETGDGDLPVFPELSYSLRICTDPKDPLLS